MSEIKAVTPCSGLSFFLVLPQIQNGFGASSCSSGGPDLASAQPSWSAPAIAEEDYGGRGPNLEHEPSTQTHNGHRFHKTRHAEEEAVRKVGGGSNQRTSDSHQKIWTDSVRSRQIKAYA